MQNIDEALLHSIFPSIDIDDWTKFKKASSIQQQKNFFNKYEIANKNNYGFSSKIPIKNTNELAYDCNLYFDINEVGFYVNYENRSKKELFSNMKSNFIINQDLSESKYYPYLFGTTIRKLIKRNQEAHVINETDKILWCLKNQYCYEQYL